VNRDRIEELAERLEEAEATGKPIPQLVSGHPDLGVDEAYEIQRLGFERKVAGVDRQIGYKLGLTSRAKQEAMGVAEPLWGRLSAAMLHPEEEALSLRSLIHPRAEPEIAFVLSDVVRGPGANVATVLEATKGVIPALEVLDSRYEEFKFTLPDVIADNASAARIILGGRLLEPSALDLQLEGVVLRADGEVAQTAAGAAVSGHPAAAVAWLANAVGEVEAGAIVLSGGLTVPIPLSEARSVIAEYTTLGRVSLRVDAG
jgi:2-keto-4-pentenoate hydratase